jgi:hypothetical protein
MMTAFLCFLAAAALSGLGSYNFKSAPAVTLIWLHALDIVLHALDIVLTLGLATLALVSYLS